MIPNIVNMDAGKACGARSSDREFMLSIYYRPIDRESAKFLIVPCIGEQAMYMPIYIE